MKGKAFLQNVWHGFIRLGAFVEHDQCQTRCVIELCRNQSRDVRWAALSHCQDNGARIFQQTLGAGDLPGGQRLREVQTAQKRVARHRRVQLSERAEVFFQPGQKSVAHRADAGANDHAFQAHGIGGKQGQSKCGASPDGLAGAHPKTSSTVRATRVAEPASSSGSRRNRWESARGATARR